jgi:DNA-binding protein H-NS
MEEEHQSAEALQAQLQQIKEDQATLERALQERRKEEEKAFASEIIGLITARGHEVSVIVDLISSSLKKGRRKSRKQRNSNYVRYVDPDNPENVYIRGRMPGWMTDKMRANGYDPDDKEQRQQFKDTCLTKVGG